MKTEKQLPKATLHLWQSRTTIFFVLLLFLLSWLFMFSKWFLLPFSIVLIVSIVFIAWILPRFFQSYKISFDNSSITVSYGIMIKTTHIMPYRKLVYVKTFSTPLSRSFGLSGVILKAARVAVIVPEMEITDAQKLASMEVNREKNN